MAESALDVFDAADALSSSFLDALSGRHLGFGPPHFGVVGADLFELGLGKVVPDRVGDDEVAVSQPLHQRRCSEPVRAVVGEVRLP